MIVAKGSKFVPAYLALGVSVDGGLSRMLPELIGDRTGSAGRQIDVDLAIKPTRQAFSSWLQTSTEERAEYIRALFDLPRRRS